MSKRGLLIIIVLGLLAPMAPADPVDTVLPPQILGRILEAPGLGQVDLSVPLARFMHGPANQKAQWRLQNRFMNMLGDIKVEIEQITFDPDPMLVMSFTATNNSSTTQTLSLSVLQPALLNMAVTSSTGSVTTQIIDASSPADGATASAPASGSIYTALIDGAAVQTLQDDPFSLVAGPGGVNADAVFFGPLATGAVAQTIGINIQVQVSPGDIAQVLARFEVVPEPATLALLACGAALFRRRRA
ncbi:MAG: PEP-CTERM sorting domain-containing protein [Planctomycetes bacterium]|nr:PEP-CTERM sorting domain-containing protein [Planctomycetota bacterium]